MASGRKIIKQGGRYMSIYKDASRHSLTPHGTRHGLEWKRQSRRLIAHWAASCPITSVIQIHRRRIALKCYAMPRLGRIAAVLLVFPAVYLSGQDKNTCNFVVQKVRFESAGGLTSEQREKLRDLVIGKCYDPTRVGSVGQYVQDQLRQWGYRKVEVYDLEKFQVLDDSVHPSPITLFIDLRVDDPTAWHACPAVKRPVLGLRTSTLKRTYPPHPCFTVHLLSMNPGHERDV